VRVELSEEMKEILSPHWLCRESGFVFFGDCDGLDVCRHLDQDLNEKYERKKYAEI